MITYLNTIFKTIYSFLLKENPAISNFSNLLVILSIIIPVGTFTFSWLRKRRKNRNRRLNRPEVLTERQVDLYTKNYIRPKIIHDGKKYSINKFIKKFMYERNNQYHLFLGESGIGKSALLINIFFQLKLNGRKGYNAEFFSLRNEDTLDKIKELEDRKNTILLLDAIDEAFYVSNSHQNFLEEIEKETTDFAKVILTSRMHFFDNSADEPNKVSISRSLTVDDELYKKYYLEGFTRIEILLYLCKKFKKNIWKLIVSIHISFKHYEVIKIPIILSFIESLLDVADYLDVSQIYAVVINKWITKEYLLISKNSKIEINQEKFIEKYNKIFNEMAIQMIKNKKIIGGFLINTENLIQISNKYSLDLINNKRIRFLLERINDDTFAFVHLSIFEYILQTNYNEIINFDTLANIVWDYVEYFRDKLIKDVLIEGIDSRPIPVEDAKEKYVLLLKKDFNCTFYTLKSKSLIMDILLGEKVFFLLITGDGIFVSDLLAKSICELDGSQFIEKNIIKKIPSNNVNTFHIRFILINKEDIPKIQMTSDIESSLVVSSNDFEFSLLKYIFSNKIDEEAILYEITCKMYDILFQVSKDIDEFSKLNDKAMYYNCSTNDCLQYYIDRMSGKIQSFNEIFRYSYIEEAIYEATHRIIRTFLASFNWQKANDKFKVTAVLRLVCDASEGKSEYNYTRRLFGCLVAKQAISEGFAQSFTFLTKLMSMDSQTIKNMDSFYNIIKIDEKWYWFDAFEARALSGNSIISLLPFQASNENEIDKSNKFKCDDECAIVIQVR